MLSIDAEKLAKDLINKYIPGWGFAWIRSQRCYGKCSFSEHCIKLSLPLVQRNTVVETTNTILHEIAHAMAGPGHNHDWYWKAQCIKIGARPERCFDPTQVDTGAEWKAECKCPGRVFKAIRKPRRSFICRVCRHPLVYSK